MTGLKIFSRTAMAAALLALSAGASAATVTFSNIVTALPALFDEATTVVDGDTLDIGLSAFTAAAPSGFLPAGQALDTISFTVTAKEGYQITGFTYAEGVSYVTSGGIAIATGSLTYNGTPASLGIVFAPDLSSGTGSLTVTKAFAGVSELSVVITNSLFAAVTAAGGAASITKLAAGIEITTEPTAVIPVPPAVWMLGSALVGLVAVGRRSSSFPLS